jgi:hypothetical protein
VINPAVDKLAEHTGVKRACELLGRPRGSHYRALEATMYATICSFHTSGVVIAEGLVS